MNNRKVEVVSDAGLKDAIGLLWAAPEESSRAEEWIDLPGDGDCPRTLILLRHAEGSSKTLPVPLDLEGATDLARRWLEALPIKDRPGWIDMDGDCEPIAFRVFCDDWGHVCGHHYRIVGIQGAHAWYGK